MTVPAMYYSVPGMHSGGVKRSFFGIVQTRKSMPLCYIVIFVLPSITASEKWPRFSRRLFPEKSGVTPLIFSTASACSRVSVAIVSTVVIPPLREAAANAPCCRYRAFLTAFGLNPCDLYTPRASTSGTSLEPSFASVFSRMTYRDRAEVIARAHGVIPGGVISDYDLSWTRPTSSLEPEERLDGRSGAPETGMSHARFVDGSASVAAAGDDGGQSWRGTVLTEELPGGGLHRHVSISMVLTAPKNGNRFGLSASSVRLPPTYTNLTVKNYPTL